MVGNAEYDIFVRRSDIRRGKLDNLGGKIIFKAVFSVRQMLVYLIINLLFCLLGRIFKDRNFLGGCAASGINHGGLNA